MGVTATASLCRPLSIRPASLRLVYFHNDTVGERCGLGVLYLEVSRTIIHQATCELKMWEMYHRQLPACRAQTWLSVHLFFKTEIMSLHQPHTGNAQRRSWQVFLVDSLPVRLSKYFSLSLSVVFFLLSISPSFLLFREKYINIILKMEEMLKSWFPNVKIQDQLAVTQTEEAVPTKKLKVKL